MLRYILTPLYALALLSSAPLLAQDFHAGLTGIVKDSQGALVPGAGVEAIALDTGIVSHTTTNQSGYYSLPVLPIGFYKVTASANGFKNEERARLELRTGDIVQLDFALQVGATNQTVEIKAEAELLKTSPTDKGEVVDGRNVADIPSVGRNPFLLGVVAAGVQFDIGAGPLSRAVRPFDSGNNVAESMTINGGRGGASDLLLDGLPNTATETSTPTNQAFVPSPDTVSEFRVQTNNYDAQYGRTAGGTISASLKSGTNKYHGTVYEYVRNTILSANTFDQNRIGIPRTAFHWNQPGLEIDGPVRLPHLYNGRNRTFFMYSYEKILDEIPSPATSTVPLPDQRTGNFNTTLQSNGQPVLVYDPLTTVQTSATTYTRQPFPGNVIPMNRFNPVAAKILPYIPLPNYPGQASNLIAAPNPRTDDYDAHVFRLDQVLTDRWKFFSRFVRGNRTEENSDNGYHGYSSPQYNDGRLSQSGGLDLTTILSPNTVLTSRAGYSRHDLWINLYSYGLNPTALGFPQTLADQVPPYFPEITMSGYTTFGAGRSQGNQLSFSSDWDWTETVNKTIGRHSLKMGGEFRAILDNINSPTSNFGVFGFTAAFTQANPLTASSANGNAFASFLLGYPNSGQVNYNPASAYGYHYYSVFVQDDWRIFSKVTLSLGGRWDYESPVTERNNQQNAGFDFSTISTLAPGVTTRGGLLFTSPGHREPYRADLNNFQPRVGGAWNINSKTVLRAGYGLSYLATFTTGNTQGFSQTTPYVATNGTPLLNGNSLSNPYPQGVLLPPGGALGLKTYLGQSISFTDTGRVIPHVQQFSVGLQRQLPFRMVIEASYVGSRSRGLDVSQQVDDVTVAQLQQYGTQLSSVSVPNPYANLLPGTSLNSATVSLQQSLRPYPQYTGITETNIPVGASWYNSLQVQFNKRLSYGLNFSAAYTHAKWLDATGYLNNQDSPQFTPERTLNATDTPHRIVLSGNWELPIFRHTKGLVGAMFGGWQANGIFVRQVGFPLAAPGGYYSSGIDPSLPDNVRTDYRYFNTCTLTTAGVRTNCASASEPVAFIQQQPDTLRVLSSRFPSIRPPKVPNADVSLFKAWRIREGLRLQVRAEAFNMTNSPQLGTPSTSLTSTTAGQISFTQTNDPRNVQMAAKLLF
jgi:hypothetical protein